MYNRKWTLALLVMPLIASPIVGANSQPISTGRAVVEVEVVPLQNGKIPRDVQCVEKVKVLKGTASIQSFTGKRKQVQENEEVCITPSGDLIALAARGELPNIPGGGVTPPCVSPSARNCR